MTTKNLQVVLSMTVNYFTQEPQKYFGNGVSRAKQILTLVEKQEVGITAQGIVRGYQLTNLHHETLLYQHRV